MSLYEALQIYKDRQAFIDNGITFAWVKEQTINYFNAHNGNRKSMIDDAINDYVKPIFEDLKLPI